MSWRVIPDCTPYLLEHHYRDGSTRRVIVGPRSVYADIDRTHRLRTLVTPLPLGVFPFPTSEITDRGVDPETIGQLGPPSAPRLIRAAVALLRPAMTVERLAAELGVSSRHLRTLFVRHIGLSPKHALRITRFRAVFDASNRQRDVAWSVLAATYGYGDQSHLIDEFYALVGESPEVFRERCAREAKDAVPLLPSASPLHSI